MAVTIDKVLYAGWPNCYRITNGVVELIATSDIGPRIIHCGFVGDRNLFAVFDAQAGKTNEPWWQIRGGHRLWIAPELVPDTYALDNGAVGVATCVRERDATLTLQQERERETGLRKQISITLADDGKITIAHQIENAGSKPRCLAPWALTVMAPGGLAIAPFPPRASHEAMLLPTNPLTMWAYTDFSDPRWTFTKKYLTLRCNHADTPQKAGLFNPQSVCAYLLGSQLFVKRYTAIADARYPDMHCSVELFTNHEFLELETLGPLAEVSPGGGVSHVEHWSLHLDVQLESLTDAAIDCILQPYCE